MRLIVQRHDAGPTASVRSDSAREEHHPSEPRPLQLPEGARHGERPAGEAQRQDYPPP